MIFDCYLTILELKHLRIDVCHMNGCHRVLQIVIYIYTSRIIAYLLIVSWIVHAKLETVRISFLFVELFIGLQVHVYTIVWSLT